ncbi:transcription termination factor 3, mitochondrial isoform X2 [Latimeria chalumnae]|uniref:transcription termination factor 3, mitochondrial isoform X2 n=1 Tax=Latimeria chalumnae TaxID=7897 RepID=UPI0006D9220A|nr:PREDICTED: transcription termination factor 3, mitochondrial isoform X2 [Latimeria chalumnae]|eukprot:XP_014350736.1 PREDICTED: transcription termination factor 3, mitochondrial isoform X2 [Latimeria chalumnae]
MALRSYQLCKKCSFLKISSLSYWLQRHCNQQPSKMWPILCSPQTLAHKHFFGHEWGLKSYRFISSGGRLQSDSTETTADGSSERSLLPSGNQNMQKVEILPDPAVNESLEDLDETPPLSPFEEIAEKEAIQLEAEPILPPVSVTLRDYVDRSETLSKLVLLGVDLSKLEQRPNVANMLLRLSFEKDIKDRLLFLKEVGVEDHQLGPLLTKNPFVLTENIENLQKRVSYLNSKKFSKEAIARMVSGAPYLLNFSVERLDNRLGFFQKELKLSVQNTRELVTRLPRLLTGSLEPVKENLKVFNAKLLRIQERHLFLKHLGRAQYDPVQPNYVSLDRLVSTPDEMFCADIAKATLQDFETFQKMI